MEYLLTKVRADAILLDQVENRAFGVVARAGGSQSLCAALLATMRWLSRDNELGGSVATAAGCTARRPRAIVRVTINGARVDVAWLGLRYWWARRTTKFGHAHDVACALVYAAAARGAARSPFECEIARQAVHWRFEARHADERELEGHIGMLRDRRDSGTVRGRQIGDGALRLQRREQRRGRCG